MDGEWKLMPLAEAHTHHRAAEKRCPDCHGKVRTQGTYSGQQGFIMTHRRVHDNCPRMLRQYAGTPKPHPEAVPWWRRLPGPPDAASGSKVPGKGPNH